MDFKSGIVAAAALLSLSPALVQATTEVTAIHGVAIASEVSGVVTVVNTQTRMLTIRDADGVFEVLHAPPEVESLDEVKVGDKLTVTKSTMIVIQLEQGRDAGSMGVIATKDVERDAGSEIGGSIKDTTTIYGKIIGVDKAAGTVTVQGAKNTETYEVEEKALLGELNVKPGDGVIVTVRDEISGQVNR